MKGVDTLIDHQADLDPDPDSAKCPSSGREKKDGQTEMRSDLRAKYHE